MIIGPAKTIKFKRTHLSECVRLYMETFHNPPFSFDWLTEDKAQIYIQDIVNNKKFCGFALCDANEMFIGFCLGMINDYFISRIYDVAEIFVRPCSRGQGYGSMFLKQIEQLLMQQDVTHLSLYTQKSLDAYQFYIKNGLIESPDTVQMIKELI